MFEVVQNKSRLFTFGCSFTEYIWTTWPQVLGKQYQVPLYNYGAQGTGNMYIFNHVMQADCYYDFRPEDIIVVCWTNVCREDRYANKKWYRNGNVLTNSQFGKDWVKLWAQPEGMAIRDYAAIKATQEFIKSKTTNYLFLSMCDIVSRVDQWSDTVSEPTAASRLYDTVLKEIKPSFYDVLWNNDLLIKQKLDNDAVHYKFIDGHPSPTEALEYIKLVTDIEISHETEQSVCDANLTWQTFFKTQSERSSQDIFRPCEMSAAEKEQIFRDTQIWPQENIKQL